MKVKFFELLVHDISARGAICKPITGLRPKCVNFFQDDTRAKQAKKMVQFYAVFMQQKAAQ